MSNIIELRQKRLAEALQNGHTDVLALNPGPSLIYLTGLQFHLMERPVVAFFKPGKPVAVVVPELELGKLDHAGFDVRAFPYTETLATWDEAFSQAIKFLGASGERIGVEPRWLRVLELRFIEKAASGAAIVSAEDVLARLRMRKDAREISDMQKAIYVAQSAATETLKQVHVGVTEHELAAELTANMLRAGSEPELPFPPIVAFGPNSANPHAVPTDRPLGDNELILLDWGANVHGYFSDLTRVFNLGTPSDEMIKIHQIVYEANRAGLAASGPGVTAGEVDRATRDVIVRAGYGEYFIHRTGHGLGLEAHEDPYIRDDNTLILEPGMTFTIEPGIYLPGIGGVRIEDNVVITDTGANALTDMPHDLVRL